MSDSPAYREVLLWVRPPRVATLVPTGDLAAGFRMMENHSQTWGGQGDVIVSLGDQRTDANGEIPEMDERFRAVLSTYDPDHLGMYHWTRRGHEMANPQRFAELLRRDAEQLVEKHGGSVEDAERRLRDDHIHRSVGAPLQLGPATELWAERRLGCFGRHSQAVRTTHEQAESDPNDELLGIAERVGQPIHRVVSPDLTAFCAEAQLMVAGSIGAISPRYQEHLESRGVQVLRPRVAEEDLSNLLTSALIRRFDQLSSFSLANAIRRERGERERPTPEYFSDDFFEVTPFACSMRGATQVHLYTMAWEERPLPVIVGNSIADFCLATAADRMLGGAIWLPFGPEPLNDEEQAIFTSVVRAINTLVGPRGRRSVQLLTMSEVDLSDAAAHLNGHQFSMEWETATEHEGELWTIPPMRVVGKDDWYQARAEVFIDHEMATRLDPLIPSFADADDVWRARWIAEASIEAFKPPRRSAVTPLLAEESDWERGAVRSSADGISFASHRMGLVLSGAPIRDALARPKLRTPRADQIVAALLLKNGMRAQPSAAGLYTLRSLDRWGGLDAFAADLGNAGVRSILDAYTSTDSTVGCYLDTTRRRFLTITDMAKVSDSRIEVVRSIADRFVADRVLRRGLLLKCNQCLHLGWYATEAIGQQFTCARCTTPQTIEAASWRLPPDEPSWFYDLAEVTYQALLHNAHVPVLALAALKAEGRGQPFDFSTDLDVFRDETKVDEIDFVAISGGQIMVGEAKKGSLLSDNGGDADERRAAAKLVEVADGLTADTIIIATASATFRQATLDHLKVEADRRDMSVRTMTSIGSAA